jgi:predicted ArsR family transcriptional regulator
MDVLQMSEPRRGPDSTLLESGVRRRIVDLLANVRAVPDEADALQGLTAAQLADELGLHVTTVRFHLDLLVRGGILSAEFRAGQVGRPRKFYRFRPASQSAASPGEAYQALAALLADSWQTHVGGQPVSPEQAGRDWARSRAERAPHEEPPADSPGAFLGKVGRTVDLLGSWGYTPELRTTDRGRTAELTLVDCPFLALAETNPAVVCGVHRGLLRGAMEAVGEAATDITLHPFVAPGRCQATITTRAAFAEPSGPEPRS